MNKVAVTGHRPSRLGGYSKEVADSLFDFAIGVLKVYKPDVIYTGMALGWDTAVARAAKLLKIDYVAVIPFPNQFTNWSDYDITMFSELYFHATERITLNEYKPRDTNAINAAYLQRDRYMVDQCNMLLSLYDGYPKGGTFHTIEYAEQKQDVVMVNVWDDWRSYNE